MPNPDPKNDDLIRCEAAASKTRVRTRLQHLLEANMKPDPIADLFADLPWQDPSLSGEYEAVLT